MTFSKRISILDTFYQLSEKNLIVEFSTDDRYKLNNDLSPTR